MSLDSIDRTIGVLERRRASGRALGSSILGTGVINDLEAALAERLGVTHALAVSSGTTAMAAALWALGVGPGDEVVVPAYDWPATAAMIRGLGATPVLADVGPSGHIDVAAATEAVGPRTAAVIATHLDGIPADVEGLRSLCDRTGIALVEDAAQALGAEVAAQPLGSWGDIAALSFSRGKPVDAGGGGAVATSHTHLFHGVLAAGQHPARLLREGLEGRACPGANQRIDAVTALLALDGMSRLDDWLAGQERGASIVAEAVASLGVAGEVPRLEPGARAAWYAWRLLLPCPGLSGSLRTRLAAAGLDMRRPDPSFYLPGNFPRAARWPGARRVASSSILVRSSQPTLSTVSR